jgi:hypothetical protein
MRRRWAAVVGGVLLGGLLAVGCAPTYTYVKNTQTRTYFRIPATWHLYDENAIFRSQIVGLSPQGEAALRAAVWMVAFDANPRPSLNDLFSPNSPYPQGFAQVRQLSPEQRENVSLAAIRDAVFPLSQLQVENPGSVEILASEDIVLPDGIHGNRTIFNLRMGQEFFTVNQTALVNPETSLLYLFVIGCEAHCYLQHQRTIDEIVKSWTVKER